MKMVYSLVHYPDIDTKRVNQLRRKYDPQVELIQPHITLMFPVASLIGEETLVNHLRAVLSDKHPFPIHLQGLDKSWDHYLFLLVDEGKDALADLHAHIYTGVLTDLRQTDLAYVPHVTLGMFGDNINEYDKALDEAKRLNLDYRCVVDKLHLIKLDSERTHIKCSREFLLT